MTAATRADATMLDVDGLKVALDADTGLVKAIDGLSLSIRRGETFALVGESGCGKSMTALALMRLLPENGGVTHGSVALEGQDVLALPESRMRAVRGGKIGMIFQEPATSLNPVMRVGDQIVEAIEAHTALRGAAARAKAIQWLGKVGIPEPERRIDEYPFRLSGGQKQRVMIAMTLAAEPDFLIADEPTTALDVTIQAQIIELMTELQKRTGSAIIMITHDLGVVADIADKVLVMYAGKPVEYGVKDDVYYRPLHPYTWGLLDSLPRHDLNEKTALCPIQGQPPSLINVPSGCAFHPRCPYATSKCRSEVPALRDIGGEHFAACHYAGDPGFERGVIECAGVGA